VPIAAHTRQMHDLETRLANRMTAPDAPNRLQGTPGRSDAPDESDGLDGGFLAEEGPDLDQPPPPTALFPRSG
jgi:hypothetical protein